MPELILPDTVRETAARRKECCADPVNLGAYPGKDGAITPGVATCKGCGARHFSIRIPVNPKQG